MQCKHSIVYIPTPNHQGCLGCAWGGGHSQDILPSWRVEVKLQRERERDTHISVVNYTFLLTRLSSVNFWLPWRPAHSPGSWELAFGFVLEKMLPVMNCSLPQSVRSGEDASRSYRPSNTAQRRNESQIGNVSWKGASMFILFWFISPHFQGNKPCLGLLTT